MQKAQKKTGSLIIGLASYLDWIPLGDKKVFNGVIISGTPGIVPEEGLFTLRLDFYKRLTFLLQFSSIQFSMSFQ